jgi:hypothetical protein
MRNAIIGLFIILLGATAWYFFSIQKTPEATVPPAQPVRVEPSPPVPEPESETQSRGLAQPEISVSEPEPEPEPITEAEPLPPLTDSDGLVLQSLSAMLGEAAVMQFLLDEDFISRFVASVDALTSRQVPAQLMAVRGLDGEFEASADKQPEKLILNTEGDPIPQFILSQDNYQRYAGQVEMFEAADSGELLALYQRLDPLFGQAWAELGYPEGSFDERLVEVIDSLLATPDVQAPIRLIKPEAFYLFADPALESLPAGQKILIRMGPENAGRVKVKLLEIRSMLMEVRA